MAIKMNIRTKLMISFLAVAVIPLSLISSLLLFNHKKNLNALAFEKLISIREVKKIQIQNYFTERKNDTAALVETIDSLMYAASEKLTSVQENKLVQLQLYLQRVKSDAEMISTNADVIHALADFESTIDSNNVVDTDLYAFFDNIKYGRSIAHIKEVYGYHDILLISKNGRVVYSTNRENDLGQDLSDGILKNSGLGRAFKEGSSKINFQDFEPFLPSGDNQIAFVGAPIIRNGDTLGVVVLKLKDRFINSIVQRKQGMGKTGETYIIGKSHGKIDYRTHRRGNLPVNNETGEKEPLKELFLSSSEPQLRLGRDGVMKIIQADPIQSADLKWVMITTMDLEEAISPKFKDGKNVFFDNYIRLEGYTNLFVLSADGVLLYAVKPVPYIGEIFKTASAPDIGLTDLFAKVTASRSYGFVDFRLYPASDGNPYALIGQPLLDQQGKVELVIALQMPINAINNIMKERTGMGKTGETYLVGPEGLMRSDSYLSPESHSVIASFTNPEQGQIDTIASREALAGKISNSTSLDYRGIEVLSAHAPIHIAGTTRWALISEIDKKEAFASLTPIYIMALIIIAVIIVSILLSLYFVVKIIRPLKRLESGAQRIGAGDLAHRIEVTSSDELGNVTQSFNAMAIDLESVKNEAEQEAWLKQGAAELDNMLRGDLSLEKICTDVLTFMAGYLKEQVGLIYVHDGKGGYQYMAGYAFEPADGFQDRFVPGEGLTGQAAVERKILTLTDIPADYLFVTSSLGRTAPRHLSIIPFVFDDKVEAVMELGCLNPLTQLQTSFIKQTADSIAIIIAAARSRQELNKALVKTTQQAEELKGQQEELQSANEEMEEQTQMLMASEGKLKEQQEELQAANEELEEKTEYLERNKKNIEEKNQALEQLRKDLEKKAEDLSIASKYKSEFLANMSHELRTPLNSLLLLSRLLTDNKEGNLLADQVDSARIIYNSGNDLLALINEILDLSKIEAGKMTLTMGEIPLMDVKEVLEKNFRGLAEEKDLTLDIIIRDSVPGVIVSDQQRIMRILKNFVSNAFKFTTTGGVIIEFYQPDDAIVFLRKDLVAANTIAVDVRDTGIGIDPDNQKIIFEAFQQVEGGSSRKYGGTGLGLSISRELANLLGGELQLNSIPNQGSTFTLFLPKQKIALASADSELPPETTDLEKTAPPIAPVAKENQKTDEPLKNTLSDDRDKTGPEDKSILIIEDDVDFAMTLLTFCRKKGFKGLVALTGEEGLALAGEYPLDAIILDIHLPGIDGWTVLETLKENPALRHIPVHFMSADDPVPEAFTKGAIGYLTKPVNPEELEAAIVNIESIINKEMKDLLLVEDNSNQRHAIASLIYDKDDIIREVSTGKEAIAALRDKQFDCMILDLGLPDMSGFDLLKAMEKDPLITVSPPVVVYTGRDLTHEEEIELRKYSESIIIKSVRSDERLLDETSLFLHRMIDKMPEEKKKMITTLHDPDRALQDRTILIVDDDMRNVFALSKVLQNRGAKTLKAENGMKALEMLEQTSDVDLVLMDIMMPVMDGYETMKKIRAKSRFNKLPIIALTAKAMQRDKEDCIAAGANDYLAKPVEIDRLLSMMRVWLY